jgi:hypothetical protein
LNIKISEYERKARHGFFIIDVKTAIVKVFFYKDNPEK